MKKVTVIFTSLLCAASALLCGCSESARSGGSVPENFPQISLDGYKKDLLHASLAYGYSGIEEMSSDCDIIARVKVTDMRNGHEIAPGLMSTIFTANVEEMIYGSDEKEMDIYMTGGIDHEQNLIQEIAGDPLMSIGDELIVFADKNESGTYSILGGPQGRFVVDGERVYSLSEYISSDTSEDISPLAVGGEALNDFIEEVKTYLI